MFSVTRESLIIFGFPIHFYGIIIALGIALALFLAEKREERFGFEKETVLSLALWVIPAAILCARLYYVVFSFDEYKSDLVSILDIRSGGMAIYGGLIGGILAGLIFARVKKLSFKRLADLAAPSIALGQAVGRWGNFVNQEAYGVPVSSPALQFFPLAVFIESEGMYFAATFFYESLWCFLIAAACLILEKKKAFRFEGSEIFLYASLYAFERMLVEGLRTDSLYWGCLRVSQLLSACALFACALSVIFLIEKNSGKRVRMLCVSVPAFAAILMCLASVLPGIVLVPAGAALALIVVRKAVTL